MERVYSIVFHLQDKPRCEPTGCISGIANSTVMCTCTCVIYMPSWIGYQQELTYAKSFFPDSVKLWNNVPTSVVNNRHIHANAL